MYHNAGWGKITISVFNSTEGKDIEGRTIAEIAKQRKRDPFELILNLIEQEGDGFKIISETMIRRSMQVSFRNIQGHC